MSNQTAIEWTDATWNPTRGCSRVSEGCRHCYAETVAARFSGPGLAYEGLTQKGKWTGEVRLIEEALDQPLRWKAPRRIFVNSMSDLFHEKVWSDWIDSIFAVMALAPQHTYQILTKRPERMRDYLSNPLLHNLIELAADVLRPGKGHPSFGGKHVLPALPLKNVWLGVSVEDQATADARIPLLLQTAAAVRWVSYEPALGPVDFRDALDSSPCDHVRRSCEEIGCRGPRGLDWIVVGGESGPSARPFDLAWARSTVGQCRAAGVQVFVKQLGSRPCSRNKSGGLENHRAGMGDLYIKDRKGGDMAEWPEDLRVREFPT